MFGGVSKFLHSIKIDFLGENKLTDPVNKAVKDLGKLKNSFDSIRSAGRKAMMFGLMMAAPLLMAAKGAASFEAGMVDVRKTTNLSFADIREGISGIVDRNIPTAIEGLNQIAATAGQLGIKGRDNIFSFTEAVAKIEAVSDLTADQAGTAFARYSNVFDVPLTKIENMGSAINELSNTTTATAGFIVDSLDRIGRPIDSLTYQNLAALAATISDVGLGAERGGTAFRNVFTRMQTNADNMAKVMGVSTQKWSSMMETDGMDALNGLLMRLREMQPLARANMIDKLFGEMAFVPVQKMAKDIDILQKNIALSNDAFEKNISLMQELKNVQDSTMGQWTVMKNQLKLLAYNLGEVLLPPVNKAFESITFLAKGFRKFSTAHPIIGKLIVSVLAMVSAILLLGGMVLWMTGAIGGAVINFKILMLTSATFAKVVGGLKIGILGLGKSLIAFFASPVGLIVLAVAALIAGLVLLYKHSEKFRNFVKGIGAAVKSFFLPMIGDIMFGLGFLVGFFEEAFIDMKSMAEDIWPDIRKVISGEMIGIGDDMSWMGQAWDAAVVAWKTGVTLAWGIITTVIGSSIKAILNGFHFVVNVIGGIISICTKLMVLDFKGAFDAVVGMFISVVERITQNFTVITDYINGLEDKFIEAGRGLISAFGKGLLEGWADLKGNVISLFDKLLPYLTGSDAQIGPLSNITGSGAGFVKAFSSGMRDESPELVESAKQTFSRIAPGSVIPPSSTGSASGGGTREIKVVFEDGSIRIVSETMEMGTDQLEEKLTRIFQKIGQQYGGLSIEPA